MRNVAEQLFSLISQESVDAVFMVPGGFVDNLGAVAASTPGMQVIVSASEAGAAMMADGYARVSGRFGVCLAIGGPGASNMLTGLSLSNVDEIPVLALTGDSPSEWRDRDSLQDCGRQGLRTKDLLAQIAKAQYELLTPHLLNDYFKRSMLHLADCSPGMVHLSLPMEQQLQACRSELPAPMFVGNKSKRHVDRYALEQAQQILSGSERVVAIIGSGVRKAEAFSELLRFSECYQIPVACTMDAKGDFPEDHPLSLGVFGWSGSPRANELLVSEDVDCLLVIGCKLGQVDSLGWSKTLTNGRRVIQVSHKGSDLSANIDVDCAVLADVKTALQDLCTSSEAGSQVSRSRIGNSAHWLKTVTSKPLTSEPFTSKPFASNTGHHSADESRLENRGERALVHPAHVIEAANKIWPDDTRVFVDNGAHTFFASHYWQSTVPASFYSSIKYSGAMGWAIPASIGAHLALPATKTLVVVGDGCMLMHGIEIQTAARYGLKNIVFLVINNSAHGNPRLRAADLSENAKQIMDIVDHDWALFAQSLGLTGMSIRHQDEIDPVLHEALSMEAPLLIDVKCGLYPTPTKVFDEHFMTDFNQYKRGD